MYTFHMLVSFYAQISIIGVALLVTVLPFLGFPHYLEKMLSGSLGFIIFCIAVTALYRGYVQILRREEKRVEQQEKREEKKQKVSRKEID